MDPRETIKTLKADLDDKRFHNRLFNALCGLPMTANEATLIIDMMKEIADLDFPANAVDADPSDSRAAHAYTLMALRREMAINVGEREARAKSDLSLRMKDNAMGIMFQRLQKAGVDYSDLIP